MEDQLQTIVSQLVMIIISGVFAAIAAYVKKWLSTNETVAKYGLYNDKVERVLENAVHYAEGAAKRVAVGSIEKRKLALEYISKVSPDITETETTEKLEAMLDRKVQQVINRSWLIIYTLGGIPHLMYINLRYFVNVNNIIFKLISPIT